MDSNDTRLNASDINGLVEIKMQKMVYIFAIIATVPLIFFLTNYIYLIQGLVRNKIWKTKPFYLAFIALGISDCLLLIRHLIVVCLLEVGSVSINASSPTFVQVIMAMVDNLYWNAFVYSSCMLGVIAGIRFIAVYFPIFFRTRIRDYSGWIAIALTTVIALLPVIIGHFTITCILYQNPATGDYITLMGSPFTCKDRGIYRLAVYILIPSVISSVFPITLYCAIAIKLCISAHHLSSNGERKNEFAFLFIGLWLCCTSLIVGSIFIFFEYPPVVDIHISINQFINLIALGLAAECLMFGINPFVYWIVDPNVRQVVKPPWQLIKFKTTVKHTKSNPTLEPNGRA